MKTKLVHSSSTASLRSFTSNKKVSSNPAGFADEGLSVGSDSAPNGFWGLVKKNFSPEKIKAKFPITVWLPLYTKRKFVADLIAGITIGILVLPQSLAYATIAGLPPQYGLYSSFVGCFVYIYLGSTKVITVGPTAMLSILTFKYINGKPPEYAVFLCACTAVVTMLFAVFRLGFIANFISRPVISGFTSAVAIGIVATQVRSHLGLHYETEEFLQTIEVIIEHFREINMADAVLSVVCISILIIMKKLQFLMSPLIRMMPPIDKFVWFISTSRSAIVLCVCTLYCAFYAPDTFSIVGEVKKGIPSFKLPPTTIFDPKTNSTHTFTDILKEEGSALIVLPLLAIVEHITIAKAFAGSQRIDVAQEILTIGVSNSIACFFSAYPIAGCFTRTTVNAFSGVETPMGGLYTGIMVLFALQYLTPYFYYIPKAALASVITSSVIFMVDFEIIMPMWRSKRMDMIPWAITFLVSTFVGLEFGVLVGLCISATYLLYWAARPRVQILEAETSVHGTKFILIVLDRSLTFPSVDYISREIRKGAIRFASKSVPVVIDCNHIQYTDFTAAEAMKSLIESLHEQNFHLIFYRLKSSTLRILKGVMHHDGERFLHCETETDLEALVDGNFMRIKVVTEETRGRYIRRVLKSLITSDAEEVIQAYGRPRGRFVD